MFDENENTQTPENGEYRYIPNQESEQINEEPQVTESATEETDQQTYTQQTYAQPQQFIPTPPTVKQRKQRKEKKAKTRSLSGKAIALVICLSLVAGFVGSAGANFLSAFGRQTVTLTEGKHENVTVDINTVETGKLMTPAEVYAKNVNSTVGITTSITTNYWGYQTTSAASGSGFIISKDGYVLTNYHVIENSSSITVSFYDGTSAPATLIGYEISKDLAVLKVNATDLTPVVLGDSDNMNIGDAVVAIGNPLGELTFTLTSGVVSALDREVTTSSGTTMNLIQTDSAINSGNSGGALFNMYGEVIGITNAKYSNNGDASSASIDGIGFAIPMNQVKKIVEGIIETGVYVKPYIGISVTDVSAETQSYGLPQGAAVKTVVEGAPADKAGLEINDIITKANDTQITGSNDLVNFVGNCEIGQTVKLTVYRMGAYIELEMTVGEQNQTAMQQQQQQTQQQQQQSLLPNIPGFFNPFG